MMCVCPYFNRHSLPFLVRSLRLNDRNDHTKKKFKVEYKIRDVFVFLLFRLLCIFYYIYEIKGIERSVCSDINIEHVYQMRCLCCYMIMCI